MRHRKLSIFEFFRENSIQDKDIIELKPGRVLPSLYTYEMPRMDYKESIPKDSFEIWFSNPMPEKRALVTYKWMKIHHDYKCTLYTNLPEDKLFSAETVALLKKEYPDDYQSLHDRLRVVNIYTDTGCQKLVNIELIKTILEYKSAVGHNFAAMASDFLRLSILKEKGFPRVYRETDDDPVKNLGELFSKTGLLFHAFSFIAALPENPIINAAIKVQLANFNEYGLEWLDAKTKYFREYVIFVSGGCFTDLARNSFFGKALSESELQNPDRYFIHGEDSFWAQKGTNIEEWQNKYQPDVTWRVKKMNEKALSLGLVKLCDVSLSNYTCQR